MFKAKNFTKFINIDKYLINTVWNLIVRLFQVGVGFLVWVYLARELTVDNYGLLVFSLTITQLCIVVGQLGLDQVVAKEMKYYEFDTIELGKVISTALILRGVASLVVVLLVLIWCFFYENEKIIIISILMLMVFFSVVNMYPMFFEALSKTKKIVIPSFFVYVVFSIIKVVIVYKGLSLMWLAFAFAGESIALYLVTSIFYSNYCGCSKKFIIDYKLLKKYLKECTPLLLSGAMVILYMKMDVLMIESFLGTEYVGKYVVSSRLVETYLSLLAVVVGSYYPKLVALYKQGDFEHYEYAHNLMRKLVFICVVFAIIISVFSEQIIILLYGQVYAESYSVLSILIWTPIFVSLGLIATRLLILEENSKIVMYKSSIGLALNLILNYFLIPTYGIQGAAYATLASQIVSAVFSNILFSDSRYIFFIQLSILKKRYIYE